MKKKQVFLMVFLWLLLATVALPAAAQVVTPAPEETPPEDGPVLEHEPSLEQQHPAERYRMEDAEEFEPVSTVIPSKAAFYSAVLPGLGQAYNNAHWKIPIIYVGGAFIIRQVAYNNLQYNRFVRNLRTLDRYRSETPPEITTIENFNFEQTENWALRFRRNRDYMVIIGTLVYALNIVDAYVEAHLKEFDLNDDLAMRIKPSLIPGIGGQPGAGISLTLNLK